MLKRMSAKLRRAKDSSTAAQSRTKRSSLPTTRALSDPDPRASTDPTIALQSRVAESCDLEAGLEAPLHLHDAAALAKNLTDLLRIAWNWAWWMEQAPGTALPLDQLIGSETRIPPDRTFRKTVGWKAQGRNFALELNHKMEAGHAGSGELVFSHQGAKVVRLQVQQGRQDLYNQWHALDLIQWRPGDWISILETSATLARDCERDLNERYFRFVFGLGDQEVSFEQGTTELASSALASEEEANLPKAA